MEFKELLFTLGSAFIIALISGPLLIPLLRRIKFGQQIREDGPKGHFKKAGTPTMGGVIILLALCLAVIRFSEMNKQFIILLVATLGYGLIGFLDDYIKIIFKRSLGLTAKQKLFGQLLVAVIVYFLLISSGFNTYVTIPIVNINVELGHFYLPLLIIIMLGTSNAVNFTDGLDGLLAGTSAIAFGAFAIIAMLQSQFVVSVFSAAMVGAVLGFLVFNAHPAKVFMGDTGSLGIGGCLAAVAMMTKTEVILVIIGGVFVIEMLSVIIQVVSFKTRQKRVFKMSPIHHHFEEVGWSEWRIVITFWTVGLLMACLGLYIY